MVIPAHYATCRFSMENNNNNKKSNNNNNNKNHFSVKYCHFLILKINSKLNYSIQISFVDKRVLVASIVCKMFLRFCYPNSC